jgi:hypothetical protein
MRGSRNAVEPHVVMAGTAMAVNQLAEPLLRFGRASRRPEPSTEVEAWPTPPTKSSPHPLHRAAACQRLQAGQGFHFRGVISLWPFSTGSGRSAF